jgi:hypothetical protein
MGRRRHLEYCLERDVGFAIEHLLHLNGNEWEWQEIQNILDKLELKSNFFRMNASHAEIIIKFEDESWLCCKSKVTVGVSIRWSIAGFGITHDQLKKYTP